MANAERGEVPFVVDNETFILRWSTNAMCELEEASRRTTGEIVEELLTWSPKIGADNKPLPESEDESRARARLVKTSTARLVFWAMLQERHPAVDIKRAGSLMERAGGLAAAMALIATAFERSAAPETKDARPPSVEAASPPPGASS